jgi:hypothetical protein
VLYCTTTLAVCYCFYGTPWLVFKFIERQPYYRKSMKEQVFMLRLVMSQFLVVLFIPCLYNMLLVLYAPVGYR